MHLTAVYNREYFDKRFARTFLVEVKKQMETGLGIETHTE